MAAIRAPATLELFGIGFLGLIGIRRRWKQVPKRAGVKQRRGRSGWRAARIHWPPACHPVLSTSKPRAESAAIRVFNDRYCKEPNRGRTKKRNTLTKCENGHQPAHVFQYTCCDRPKGRVPCERPLSELNTVPYISPLQQEKAAASNLKMAKMYADSRPDKARQYAQKVIDALPKSAEAGEARQLLERLRQPE